MDVETLKMAVPYIRAYKNKIFVVKLSGELCAQGRTLDNIFEQLGILYQLGVKLVVVHGGGRQATDLSKQLGVESTFVDGRRVTSPEMLEVTKMAFAGVVNTDLIASARKHQIPAVGLTGVDADVVKAKKRPAKIVQNGNGPESVDYGFVGDIDEVRVDLLKQLLDGNYVPVLCSLGADESGQILNINADTVASQIAIHLGATKYCLLSNVDGVLSDKRDPSTLVSSMDIAAAERMMQNGSIQNGMIPKITSCLNAIRNGVPRVHVLNGLTPDALVREIFTNEGIGTLIIAEDTAAAEEPALAVGA